jgi:hypothetical protein
MGWFFDIGIQAADAGDGKVIAGNVGAWPEFPMLEGFFDPSTSLTSERGETATGAASAPTAPTAPRAPTAPTAPSLVPGISSTALMLGAGAIALLVIVAIMRR